MFVSRAESGSDFSVKFEMTLYLRQHPPPNAPIKKKGEYNIEETFCDFIQSTLVSSCRRLWMDSDMIQTSAKKDRHD